MKAVQFIVPLSTSPNDKTGQVLEFLRYMGTLTTAEVNEPITGTRVTVFPPRHVAKTKEAETHWAESNALRVSSFLGYVGKVIEL